MAALDGKMLLARLASIIDDIYKIQVPKGRKTTTYNGGTIEEEIR